MPKKKQATEPQAAPATKKSSKKTSAPVAAPGKKRTGKSSVKTAKPAKEAKPKKQAAPKTSAPKKAYAKHSPVEDAKVLTELAGGARSKSDLMASLGCSEAGLDKTLRVLRGEGKIVAQGSTRNTTYRAA